MYLNFKKINSAKREPPMLRLQTLAGKELGPVPFVQGLNFEINYSDLSTIEFNVPFMVNGLINPLYASLTGYKVIYTEELGVYMITNPEKSGDGMKEIKQVKGYSLEYAFQKKTLYLDEGTYCFWNPAFPEETILGRIVELDPNWSVGYVAPRLMNCYRTFDQYDNSALSFCYGEAMEKYRCAIVFDVYNKTINAYDAGDDTGTLPIYLDYENLTQSIKVTEDSENMATLLHLYGGNGLTIRDVNPINGDYIVDLSFFLNNGDLDVVPTGSTEMLSAKVRRWRADVQAQQPYYTGLISLRSAATSRKVAAQAALNELNGELKTLTAQQMLLTKEHSLEKTDSGRANKQAQLDAIYAQIEAKNREIKAKEQEIADIEAEAKGYTAKITAVSSALSINGYFTEAERLILTPFLIEGELTEETFVASELDASNTAIAVTASGSVSIINSEISKVSLPEFSRTVYTLSGGTLSLASPNFKAEIVRGTMDVKSGNTYTLTAYLGATSFNGHDFSKGMITISGSLSGLSSDITAVIENSITQYLGTQLSFRTSNADAYFTIATNEYQMYAVELELYDFGTEALRDYAWPVYEFDIETSNFLYQEKFEPFKNKLELGKGVHLQLGSEGLICPKVIGVKLNFEDISKFSLIFSNRYQRRDELEYLNDEIKSSAKTTSRFNANKYLYDRAADKMTDVDLYMKNMLDAAVQTIKAAANQSVMIDNAGIHVSSSNDNIQLRIVNGMIAMTDDNWKTAKLAIGKFYSKEHKMDLWGVNAELIAGTLLLGSSLYIQTQGGFFTVDDNGVYVNALKFYINNGKNLGETLDGIDDNISSVSSDVSSVRRDFDSVTKKTSSGVVLDATDLNGVISATKAQMKGAGGNVLFDSDGIWLMNNTTKATTTKAVWMNENGILFGSGPRTSNPATSSSWKWTTAISHDGVVAENIAAGTLSGMTISGGQITIGKSSNSDNTYFHVDSYGNLGIGRNTNQAKGYNFYVDYNGNMYANSGEFRGKLVGATGTFSGALSAATGTFAGSLSAATGTFAGSLSAATGTFSGSLSAVNGTFTGTLSAARISGSLTANSGAEIVGPAIYVPNKSYPKFKVDSQGNVTMTGNLTLGSGAISWSNLDWGTQNAINNAQTTANNASWTASDAANAASDAQWTADRAYDLAQANQLPYYITRTKITSTTIESPTITGNVIVGTSFELSNHFGSIAVGYGATDIDMTYGIKMMDRTGRNYVICTSAGARMTSSGASFYVSGGSITATREINVSSDRRVKNSIDYNMDRYEGFFRALNPCRFLYNNDGDKCFHIGYVAQDVKAAMDKSGLDSVDFAGYVVGVKTGLTDYDDELALGYSEFIALNTHMIQKLLRRVEMLEAIIQSMKS